MSVTLGEQYTDNITGFTGMATMRCEYLARHTRVSLERAYEEDHKRKIEWFDECSLIAIAKRVEAKGRLVVVLFVLFACMVFAASYYLLGVGR